VCGACGRAAKADDLPSREQDGHKEDQGDHDGGVLGPRADALDERPKDTADVPP